MRPIANGNETKRDRHRSADAARRSLLRSRLTVVPAITLALAFGLAACGGSSSPGVASTSSSRAGHAPGSAAPPSGMAGLLAYAHCMRRHGILDFPDPTPNPNGSGGSLNVRGGTGSDLSPSNPKYNAANGSCQALLPSEAATPAQSAQRIAAAVKLAHCMRSHGVPTFPDPNGQGAFDRSRLDPTSATFQSALNTCRSVAKYQGAIAVY